MAELGVLVYGQFLLTNVENFCIPLVPGGRSKRF